MTSAQLPPPYVPTLPSLPMPALRPPEPFVNSTRAPLLRPPDAFVNPTRAPFLTGGTGCAVCSRKPALGADVRKQVGLIFARQVTRSNVVLCREHGVKRAWSYLIQTAIFGWWGVISFFVNFTTIATDLAALRRYRALAAPQGTITLNRSPLSGRKPFGGKKGILVILCVMLATIVVVAVGELAGFNKR